jgi:hypothetical protein
MRPAILLLIVTVPAGAAALPPYDHYQPEVLREYAKYWQEARDPGTARILEERASLLDPHPPAIRKGKEAPPPAKPALPMEPVPALWDLPQGPPGS